jgi:hypothetical protein
MSFEQEIMMRRKLFSLGLGLALLVLAAVPALAQASTGASSLRIPIQYTYGTNQCTGEPILLQGTLHLRANVIQDEHTGFHYHFSRNWQNTVGLGLWTGNEYQVVGGDRVIANFPDANSESYTVNAQSNLVGEGQDENVLLQETYHLTVNANGEWTADVANVVLKCE